MVTPTSAAPLSSPRIWIRSAAMTASQPCAFGRSMFDALMGDSTDDNHYDRQLVSLNETTAPKEDYHVRLEPVASGLPFGRARPYPAWGATACPTTIKPPPTEPKKPHPQLAVVGLVLDPTGQRVLLTRRPSYMRSFPGAWVLPGGGWDAEVDANLQEALNREIVEETGLELMGDVKPICLWESVYPTDPHAPGPIKAHYLVVFLQGYCQQPKQELKLCESEVESALWLSVEQFRQVLERMEPRDTSPSSSVLTIHKGDGTTYPSSLDTIVGIYPQPDKDAKVQKSCEFCGIAQGSLFALQELLRRSDDGNVNGKKTTGWGDAIKSSL